MIWNGPENNVSIKAYKGDTGDTLLASMGGIMIGDTVTVNGFAGSPNDVTWEVFDQFGVKIGDSIFHLSCSDGDMNGPEDCGKLAGDGKGGSTKGSKKSKKKSKSKDTSGDSATDLINQWLFEGMVDAGGTLSCSGPGGGNPGAPFPTEDACFFTSTSADVTYGYTVTNMGDPVTGIMVTDDQLGAVGGPIDLGTGESAQFTASTTIFGTTTNIATATGLLANGVSCPAMDSLTVEKVTPPGSCDDGKATELVFSYVGDACSATTNYQLKDGNPNFFCDPDPGVALGGLSSIVMTEDASEVSVDIIGNTVRIFRSDTIGEKLNSETSFRITDVNGLEQSQTIHTSCSKPLAVGDQFGALVLIQLINEF
jgi:hypothetical protein